MGALDGLLVVALEQAVAAPLCTARLADAGARVIKIERTAGETARHYDHSVKGTSAYFAWLNRGKESAVLDLKTPDGLRVFRNMLTQTDVLVQNLVPGALGRLGLGPQTLAWDFPRLVTLSITGFHHGTSHGDMRAYDMLIQAESGLCAVTGTPDTPSKVGVSAADIGTGLSAHGLILEALIERGRTGRGKSIEVAMFDCMADWMAVPLLHHDYGGKGTGRHGLSHASIYPYRPFPCADGTLIVAIQTDAEFARLTDQVMERPELGTNSAFQSNADRVANRTALDTVLEPFFAARRVADVTARLAAAGLACARYREVPDLATHPALRRCVVTLPEGADAALPCPPGRGGENLPQKVPAVGEQTAAILAEFWSHGTASDRG
ncbi:MAG: CaiB/BaiF CoA-transferase family protein [Pseudomonadota bacterium]